MKADKKVLIILPTYNEIENLDAIIEKIFSVDSSIHILVVDDSSPDGTGELAEKLKLENSNIHVMHRKEKNGLGRAYLDGFRYALKKDYEYIFEMDADFSHNPEYIPNMLKAAETDDLIIGSRYITGVNIVNWPMSRLLISYFGNVYARFITGLPVHDTTGGFKLFRRKVLENINFDKVSSSGYSFQIEINFIVWKKGFKIKEIPIIFVDRELGESKMSTGIIKEATLLLWKLRLKSIFSRKIN